ncbi:uncharacterized protein LOC119723392 [Patiria miniata]|uniref:BTB domain-containing protein n=1 Tax=Patiria miniata TaxID=46514 RepID=A0A913ZEN3_PATMI|nr:uncharacterized protein LOC119723392 [Patiria miniata]XP_038049935.1 uncharacterized protein LOC119723392 [Patiria miniata]
MSTRDRHVNCPASLGARLALEFNNQDFSDVKLVVGKKTFYTHRMLLANQSEMFRIMFKGSQWLEATQEEIDLTELRECEAVFHDFLQFFYSARIHLTTDNIVAVRILADKYQHIQLIRECDRFIQQIIVHDEIDVLVGWLVNMVNLGDKLEQRCLSKLQLDYTKLMTSESSRNLLTLDLLMKIVDSPYILVRNELMLFKLLAGWIMERRHQSSQKSALTKLLPFIRFEHMTIEQLGAVESSHLGVKYPDVIMKHMFEAYKIRAQLAVKDKEKEKAKKKDKDKDKDAEGEKMEVEKPAKFVWPTVQLRLYTDSPWGSGYTKPIDTFLSTEYDIGNFSCPVMDMAVKSGKVTQEPDTWIINYKREVKTYIESEDQVISKVLVSHDFTCKYKITPDQIRNYELVILTGYVPTDEAEDQETAFTTLTAKKHLGTIKPIALKTHSRRRIKFTEILKPALLGGCEYVFSVGVYFKENKT